MILIRPAIHDDVERLFELAKSIEGGGLTTLPADRQALTDKIAASQESFAKTIEEPGPEAYLLVLEDLETDLVQGTAAVFAQIGIDKAFYSYATTKTTHVSSDLRHHLTHDVLHLVNDYLGYAEVGTLYLAPEARKPGYGRALARSRYLLMASRRDRFPDKVVAEMRGWQDEAGESPFWNALGKHFFKMDFQQADYLSAVGNNQFIADLMPKFPVYVDLLPPQAQAVIGKAHKDAEPALALLKQEGFHSQRHVDIFDAGPCVEARIDEIAAVRESCRRPAKIVADLKGQVTENVLIAVGNGSDFTVSFDLGVIDAECVTISWSFADQLKISDGMEVIATPLR